MELAAIMTYGGYYSENGYYTMAKKILEAENKDLDSITSAELKRRFCIALEKAEMITKEILKLEPKVRPTKPKRSNNSGSSNDLAGKQDYGKQSGKMRSTEKCKEGEEYERQELKVDHKKSTTKHFPKKEKKERLPNCKRCDEGEECDRQDSKVYHKNSTTKHFPKKEKKERLPNCERCKEGEECDRKDLKVLS